MFDRYRTLGRVLLCLAIGAMPLESVSASGHEESFRQGVSAGDRKRWQEAVEHMAEAIAENPTESKKRIALSGVFSAPYMPHFYRGWFLYQLGTEHCEQVLEELGISLDQGVVQGFKKQFEDLEKAREICGARVLPGAIRTAEERIEAVENRLSAPLPIDDSTLLEKLRQAREKLQSARASLDSGRQASRPGLIRRAAAEAESATALLNDVERASARQSTGELDAAGQAAERSLDRAERERRALEQAVSGRAADQRPALATSPEDAARRLKTLRQALTVARRASDLAAVRQLREDADELRSALESSRQAVAEAVASAPPVAPAAEEVEEAVVAVEEPPPAAPVVSREPPDEPAAPSAPSLAGEIRRLTASAELFLDRIGAGESGSELLELQRSRLSDLVFEAKDQSAHANATVSALETLVGRLADSLAALQLIAGAQAYFAGNPQQAVELLSTSEPPTSPLGAHFHLLLSASRYALFQVGLLENTGLAGADARRCRELDPDLVPDPRTFSPGFRQFFSDALAR